MSELRGASILVAVSAVFLLAPTPGAMGGCGKTAEEMSASGYARARKITDCGRCTECGVQSDRCVRACNERLAPEIALPATCRPLLHDGVVCIRAINAASCAAFASYVDERAPVTPSECAFCLVPPPSPPGSFVSEAGADGGDAEAGP